MDLIPATSAMLQAQIVNITQLQSKHCFVSRAQYSRKLKRSLRLNREENQAAREKKAIAKANRTKTPKSAPAKSDEKRTTSKKRAVKARRMTSSSSESSATPEPVRQQAHEVPQERPHLHIEPHYTVSMPVLPAQPIGRVPAESEHILEHEDNQSISDSAETYFGYLSSSTTSLQSSIYDPVYAHESLPYITGHHDYHIPVTAPSNEPAYYGRYDFLPGESKVQPPAPPPLSYPMDSPQPSGLCLYIPPEEPAFTGTFSPYASVSTPTTPMLSHNFNFPNPSPPMYQGPIDWNSRPLVPFHETPHSHHNVHHHHQQLPQLHHHHQQSVDHHRPRSYSDVPMYTQTVSLDQVCSAGV